MLFVSTGNEGTPVAGWLGSRGLSAHVLEYRTLPSGSDHELGMRFETGFADGSLQRDIAGHIEVAAADVADAVRWARERHDKVVVLGFSAGAIATMRRCAEPIRSVSVWSLAIVMERLASFMKSAHYLGSIRTTAPPLSVRPR